MSDLAAAVVPANLLATQALPSTATSGTAGPQMSAGEAAKRAQIKDTANKFESSFLSVMIGQMFEHQDDGVDKAFSGVKQMLRPASPIHFHLRLQSCRPSKRSASGR